MGAGGAVTGAGGAVPVHRPWRRKIGPPSGAKRWRTGRHRSQRVDLGGQVSGPLGSVSFSEGPWRPVSGRFLQCFIGARFPSYSEPTQSETENRPWWSLSQTEYQSRLVILEWDGGGGANDSQPAHDRSRRFVRSNRHTGCPHFLNQFDSAHRKTAHSSARCDHRALWTLNAASPCSNRPSARHATARRPVPWQQPIGTPKFPS